MGTISMLSAETGYQIRFDIKKPPKKFNVVKMASLGNDRYLAINSKGTIYGIGCRQTSKVFYAGLDWVWIPSFAEALNNLGLLSDADMKATIYHNQKACETNRLKWDVSSLKDSADKLGIKLTKAQLKAISKKTGEPL